MTLLIAKLTDVLRQASSLLGQEEADELGSLIDALSPFEELPLQSLTTKLRQVVLKKPPVKAAAKKKAAVSGEGNSPPKQPRAKKPKMTDLDRQAVFEAHVDRLKNSFDEDGAFAQAFDLAKSDTALDAKLALKLFEQVIGPVNFPADPPRKPSIFKQLREQRNTIVYRRERTGQLVSPS
jgi:hypothetical protein